MATTPAHTENLTDPFQGPDAFQFETHWYENLQTGEQVEFKTKFPDYSNGGYR
jgi:hypothetical protein